ncbi:MAG TPA: PEGA domain-containing protein, partial [Kofleriaceae bacterium]
APHASRPRSERTEPGVGTLMISSKPPCEIVIDGRATGLTTPQRAIALSAGSHRVTLRNSEKSIRKTLTVQIAANATEKVIEDLMK